MSNSKLTIGGWIFSVLLAAFFCFSASGKLTDWEGKEEMMGKLGFSIATMRNIGFVELAITAVYLIPQAAFIGSILLTAYMGGAVVTHVRVGEPFVFQVVFGVLVWIGYALRRPDVIKAAFSSRAGRGGG